MMYLQRAGLVDVGVRFVQLYCGSGSQWDAHRDLEGNHSRLCARSDQPTAAIITDLKQRGLLDQTLVVWGGEFGRTPMNEKTDGRDHNPYGFSMAFAGGGVKAGLMHRRDRRIRTSRHRRSCTCSRLARNDASLVRSRSQTAHVPARRSGRTPHHQRRPGHSRNSGVMTDVAPHQSSHESYQPSTLAQRGFGLVPRDS